MINAYQSEILKLYEALRDDEARALTIRREEISHTLPEALDTEKEIGRLCVELSILVFKNIENKESYLETLKEKVRDLRVKKSELLFSKGYPITYLDMHYNCEKCKDTGFIGIEKCSCYKQKLVNVFYKNSELKDLLKVNNFESFNINYYSTKKFSEESESPRKNMEGIVSRSLNFIKNFDKSNENFLFYGSPGTGKSFLSNCIAKELLDKGFLVVYRTAEALIQNLRQIRFEGNSVSEELLLDCDLLIIDDLGAEQISDFSRVELFNLLNTKILKNKKMLVSTNCALEELWHLYSERIVSRLMGNFIMHKFYGDDIRIKKNLSKK